MSDLPTTPIGKQQVIDLKAGAILRENARKNNLYFGFPIGILLFLIIILKCTILSIWMIREYEVFDFRCSTWDSESAPSLFRVKRWALFSNSDPRNFIKTNTKNDQKNEVIVNESKNRKPIYAASRQSSLNSPTSEPPKIDPRFDFGPLPPTFQRKHQGLRNNEVDNEEESEDSNRLNDEDDDLPLSTMVTLTNTQIIPLKGGEQHGVVKMKTIRNRVEKIGSDEEQFIEIDIANAPRIYVSKIKSRHGGEESEDQSTNFDLLKDLSTEKMKKEKKMKKKKGKGLKKAKKLEEERRRLQNQTTSSAEIPEKIAKKKNMKNDRKMKEKKKKKKQMKLLNNEITKSPRHLVSGSGGSATSMTTPRPHKSSWINGIVDPDDVNFSNQGQIRGYPMHRASKKPTAQKIQSTTPNNWATSKENLKISESTKLMWEMDELKYTTFVAPPKTTEITKAEVGNENLTNENEARQEKEDVEDEEEEEAEAEAEKKEEKSEESNRIEKKFEAGILVDKLPTNPEEVRLEKSDVEKLPEASYNFFSGIPSKSDPPSTQSPPPPRAPSPPYYVEINDADTETVYIKDVTPIYRNMIPTFSTIKTQATTTIQYDPQHFENELTKLKESTICLSRMAFDVWALFILFSSIPFIMGICVPRWSLFVLHIVFDFLFLVVTFVSSLTIAIMSIIMYFLVDEMSSDSLFEFLCVAFIIDIILVIYTVFIIISYRCCCRLVENFIKGSNETYCVTNGQQI